MTGAIGSQAIASGAIGGAATTSRVSPLTATTYRFPGPVARYAIAGTVIGAGPSATYYRYVPSGSLDFSGDALAYRQTRRTIMVVRVHGAQATLRQPLGSVPTLDDLTGRQPTLTEVVGHG